LARGFGGLDAEQVGMFGMDSFEFNKIAGAVLGALLFVMGTGLVADVIFAPRGPQVAGYLLPVPDAAAPAAAEAAPAQEAIPLPVLLAKADPAKGAGLVKACQACHAFEKDGANKVGPGLYGVVGNVMASHAGFKYSEALKERGAKGDVWSFESLDKFIANPKGYVPGTVMAYAGLKEADRRADIIAYLRTLSDNPVPLPAP
jgi:cytochrome c